MEEIREDSILTLAEIKNGYEKFVENPTADDFSSLMTESTLADEWQVIDNNMSKSTVDGTNLLKIENAYDELYNRYGLLYAGIKLTTELGTQREEEKDKKIAQWEYAFKAQCTKNEYFLGEMGALLREYKGTREALDIKIANQDIQIKQKNEQIADQDIEIKQKNEQIANQDIQIKQKNEQIADQDIKIDKLSIDVQKLTETLKDRDEKIVNLESERNQLILENEQSDKTIVELQKNGSFEENQKLHVPVTSTKHVVQGAAIGIKSDRWKGFKHTINWVDDNEVNDHNKKILERNLKIWADLGNNVEVTNLLKANRDIVNGRGEPDSLRSTIFSYEDKTPLMLAAKNGHADCVQTLINYNADVNYLDRHNKTALDYAHKFWKKHKNSDVREPLWANGALPSSCCEISESTGTPSPYTGTPTK